MQVGSLPVQLPDGRSACMCTCCVPHPVHCNFQASTDGQPRARLQLWQVLPLVPPEDTYWSPYSGLDALCGNPLLIDLEDLVTRGLLDPKDLPAEVPLPNSYMIWVYKTNIHSIIHTSIHPYIHMDPYTFIQAP
jgi:4-alpha-glucanotransferase